jgi:hypothetical protein
MEEVFHPAKQNLLKADQGLFSKAEKVETATSSLNQLRMDVELCSADNLGKPETSSTGASAASAADQVV